MIYLHWGRPGAGKTLFAVKRGIDWVAEGRRVYATPPSCTAPLIMDNNGQCVPLTCETGYTAVNGICQPSPPACSGGTIVNGVCVPTCTAGKTYVAGSGCVQIATTTCNGGTLTGSGTTAVCTCTAPLVLLNGTCSTPLPTVSCMGGVVISGMCICSGNQVNNNGVCQTPTGDGSGDPGKSVDMCTLHPTAAACLANAASGGSDCTTAPMCNGDGILCNLDMQEWLSRCPRTGDIPSEVATNAADLDATLAAGGSSVIVDGPDGSGILQGLDTSGQSSSTCVHFDNISCPGVRP